MVTNNIGIRITTASPGQLLIQLPKSRVERHSARLSSHGWYKIHNKMALNWTVPRDGFTCLL